MLQRASGSPWKPRSVRLNNTRDPLSRPSLIAGQNCAWLWLFGDFALDPLTRLDLRAICDCTRARAKHSALRMLASTITPTCKSQRSTRGMTLRDRWWFLIAILARGIDNPPAHLAAPSVLTSSIDTLKYVTGDTEKRGGEFSRLKGRTKKKRTKFVYAIQRFEANLFEFAERLITRELPRFVPHFWSDAATARNTLIVQLYFFVARSELKKKIRKLRINP